MRRKTLGAFACAAAQSSSQRSARVHARTGRAYIAVHTHARTLAHVVANGMHGILVVYARELVVLVCVCV